MADLRDGFLFAALACLRDGQVLQLFAAPVDCCPGRIADGPAGCTCWEPVFDLDQVDPDPAAALAIATGDAQPEERPRMCGNCAYRPNSPEKTGQATHAGNASELERLARTGERFYCHDGMRVPVAWRHPAGMRIPAAPDRDGDYQPPIVLGTPFRVDGRPGLLCAGWAARRRAITAQEVV